VKEKGLIRSKQESTRIVELDKKAMSFLSFQNLFDSLLSHLIEVGAFEVLAYGDYLASICRDEKQINRVIDTLEKRSLQNHIPMK
jgi:SOS response regulatory protein OraA/RecX